MERPLIEKMKENYFYFGGISLIYGILFTFCLYKNFSGITVPVLVIATISVFYLFMKKIGFTIQKGSKRYMIGMILLGLANCFTTNTFFIFFDCVGIILLMTVFMIHQFYNDWSWEFLQYFKNIIVFLGTMLGEINRPFKHAAYALKKEKGKSSEKGKMVTGIALGLLISILLLIIILPLLLKSDMVFTNLFHHFFSMFEDININIVTPVNIFIYFIIGFVGCYAFFTNLCKYNLSINKKERTKYYSPVIGITFNVVLSILYVIYSMIQIMYLFIGVKNGLPKGITYSEYARSGFWELLFVSLINFFLVLICSYIFEENKILKVILTIISSCTFIMIASAAYRMLLYVEQYHLTFLRILVLWFLLIEAFYMAGLIYSIYGNRFSLFRYLVMVTMCGYIALVYSRPDRTIAKYNLSQDSVKASDVYYIMYNLSLDAVPELEEVDFERIEFNSEEEKEYHRENMKDYMSSIVKENKGIYFRKANYSRIEAKLAAERYLEKVE